MSVFQVAVEFHRLEPLVPFWLESPEAPVGPVVAPTPRGPQLGWIRQLQERADKPFPTCQKATPQDLRQHQARKLFAAEVQAFAQRELAQLDLGMHLEGTHQVLGGDLLVIYFSAPERVDFRPLVKSLAQQYHKKIELFQLNSRQRTQNQGAQGRCGRECCCIAWLRDFPSVSIRMAEEQGFQLQPEAITGVCGRLLCCLRYEYDIYLEQRQLPQPGDWVDTPEGRVEVLEVDPHTSTLLVNNPNEGPIRIPLGRAKKIGQCQSCQKGTEVPLE